MPELPEVETLKNQITPYLPLKIVKIEYSTHFPSLLKTKEFQPAHETIIEIKRIGKILDFLLDSKNHIISGLGMSGGWRIANKKFKEKHTHLQFICKNKKGLIYLAYVDPRRFGRIHFVTPFGATKILSLLGPDPTSPEFNFDYILKTLKKYPNRQIKPFLLDQKFFAGIGNYMASEICARSGIRPTRRSDKITKQEIKKLKFSLDSVISENIINKGLTFSGGYVDANGEKGEGVKNLVVFHQKTCGLCKKTLIKKITLAQRGTYYCPFCQS